MILLAVSVQAQIQLSLANLGYESPNLVAPVFYWLRDNGQGGTLALGMTGWTFSSELKSATDAARERDLRMEITPRNSHRSDEIYPSDPRYPARSYRNSTALLKAGMKLKPGRNRFKAYRVSALWERVDGLETELEDFWRWPFAGLEFEQGWQRIVAEEPLIARLEGWRISAKVQGFGGRETWGRAQVSAHWGKRLGALSLRGQAEGFRGWNLNTVSHYLVGGSWELPGVLPLHGYRYGELRLDRGLLLSVGADWRCLPNFEMGWRSAGLGKPWDPKSGHALKGVLSLQGIPVTLGLAMRDNPLDHRIEDGVVIFASISAALFVPLQVVPLQGSQP